MIKHLRYLGYVLRHKWFVFVECWRLGIIWRGITHDLSKLYPSEWFPYVDHFYGKKSSSQVMMKPASYCKMDDIDDQCFNFAWLKHQNRNDHHWQWWCSPSPDGDSSIRSEPMSDEACREMVADWRGANRAQGGNGKSDTISWYREHKDKMFLADYTRRKVEDLIGYTEWRELRKKLPGWGIGIFKNRNIFPVVIRIETCNGD